MRGWLPGETADRVRSDARFAVEVGEFLVALRGCDATGGPAAGEHSWYRGASLTHYDDETRQCLAALDGRVDTAAVGAAWDAALAAEWRGDPVWFHGDVAAGNLLVRDGRLTAVIDFGTSGVGDPACDLVIAWTLFEGESREAFRHAVGQDEGTWARARGWVLWKALLGLAGDDPAWDAVNQRVIREVLAEVAG